MPLLVMCEQSGNTNLRRDSELTELRCIQALYVTNNKPTIFEEHEVGSVVVPIQEQPPVVTNLCLELPWL